VAAIGQLLQESETVSYILVGLGANYDPTLNLLALMTSIYSHLLSHELWLEQNQTLVDLSSYLNCQCYTASTFSSTQEQSLLSSWTWLALAIRILGVEKDAARDSISVFQASKPFLLLDLHARATSKVGTRSTTSCWHRFDQSYQADSNQMAAFIWPHPALLHTSSGIYIYHDTGSTNHLTNKFFLPQCASG
jgi:hypothetical protein